MKTLKTLEPLATRLLEIQRINSAASVLSWDQETYMPAGGGGARAEQLAALQGIAHQQLVSSDTERLLGTWLDLHTGLPREQDGDSGTNRPTPCCVKCGEITAAPKNSLRILSCG